VEAGDLIRVPRGTHHWFDLCGDKRIRAVRLFQDQSGWMPHYMYRMDHAAKFNFENGVIKGLSKVPSEYIKSNVWMTFQDDLTAFNSLHQMPHTQLLWASDFPHTDSTWPRSQQLLAEHTAHLNEQQRQAIMRENAAKLFNLPAGEESWRMNGAPV